MNKSLNFFVKFALGLMLATTTAAAAPTPEIPAHQLRTDFTYAPSKNSTAYFNADQSSEIRNTNGNLNQYSATYGLSAQTALSLAGTAMNFDGYTDLNGTSTPNMFVVDLQLQQRVARGIALFAGLKHITGTWTYSSSQGMASQYHTSKDEIELGALLEMKIAKNLSSFAKIGISPSTTQYKIGLQFTLNKTILLEAGYHHLAIRGVQNPQFASNLPITDSMNVTAGGPFFGLSGIF